MKKRKLHIVTASFILLSLISFIGCEKIIEDFDFLQSDPKLVVNAPLVADSMIIFHVSQTVGIMENDSYNYVDNAVAELYSNSVLLSTASYIDTGLYSFSVVPQAGASYTLKVESPDYPPTQSIIDMPDTPSIVEVGFIGWDNFGLRFDIKIDDPGGKRNAYGLKFETVSGWFEFDNMGNLTDTIIDSTYPVYLTSSDADITGGIFDYVLSTSEWEDYYSGTTMLIEDKLVDGKEFSVSVSTSDLFFAIQIGAPIFITLESYDEAYLRHLYSLEMYYNANNNPIAEKVTLFTNIEGGLGVAYGKTLSKTSIILSPEIVGDPDN